ncbi:MAG: permease, partial [Rickettsiales bacterium]|nr:permease [Rickettsiales bacterium]
KIISTDEIIRKIDFLEIFTEFLNFLTNFAGNFSLVLIYLIFFVFEEKFFEKKLKEIANNKKKLKVFEQINDDIYNYFRIKIFTSFFTGILTFLILFILKNDLSTVFGIFSFFLNFIPYIGSLLSVLLPTIFSYVQFLDPINCSLTFFSLLVTQIFLGNFIEPKLMSKSLNLSPVILMLFLSLMGKLWGVSGMFLSVPTLVVLLIIFNNFKETKKIAIFLSEKGINKNL